MLHNCLSFHPDSLSFYAFSVEHKMFLWIETLLSEGAGGSHETHKTRQLGDPEASPLRVRYTSNGDYHLESCDEVALGVVTHVEAFLLIKLSGHRPSRR